MGMISNGTLYRSTVVETILHSWPDLIDFGFWIETVCAVTSSLSVSGDVRDASSDH